MRAKAGHATKLAALDKLLGSLYLAGEHCDYQTLTHYRKLLGIPVIDNWWQTESSWPIACALLPLGDHPQPPPGASGPPVPGWDVRVLRADGTEAKENELGRLMVRLPLPPGAFCGLWRADARFVDTYFRTVEGYYDTMDAGHRDELGNIYVMSRLDDVINVAGHRLSSGHLEEAISLVPEVAESAVIGLVDPLKGHVPLALCVLKAGVTKSSETLVGDIVQQVRSTVGPVAALKKVVIVKRLPKTRSGKVTRGTLALLANGESYRIPGTIEDPKAYEECAEVLKGLGIKTGHPK